jgi:tetratricopeptide (TPR) repeat protein
MRDLSLRYWKLTGLIATLFIISSIPVYLLTKRYTNPKPTSKPTADFVGRDDCRRCHKAEYDKWQTSHHRWAMGLASPQTVLGDFNHAVFEHGNRKSTFFRKSGKYYVRTPGPEGKLGEFEITHTFGWYPLQQYLIPFPGGRLQCLSIAWDVKKKKWYHLYPNSKTDPDDWLYWTNQGQNWNGMCGECHSTNFKKNYDPERDIYRSSWSEISVGCEACHGPGSEHVKWADMPEMGRPQKANFGLAVRTSGLTSQQQIELCAPCHSRRMSLGDNPHTDIRFLDYAVPQLLTDDYYFSDGQILEEVYVYGSFMQSKMFAREVRCSDCHDVHSIKRIQPGNALCFQCHKAAIYDSRDHHFHKKEGEVGEPIKSASGEILFQVGSGAQCEQCHMPGRTYMGVDYRFDHSFRIPRPDLSVKIKSPNSCNRCHQDKSHQWSVDTLAQWYGQRKRPHYGTVLAAGRRGEPTALADLIRLADDRLYPAIVRATALTYIAPYSSNESENALHRALADEEPLMRFTALRILTNKEPRRDLSLAGPLLYDSIKAVRIEAARFLSTIALNALPRSLRKRYQTVLAEYQQAMNYTADFSASRHNLGNLYTALGQHELAIQNYQKAIEIDDLFYPAKVNLAMAYNRQRKNQLAEKLFREVVADFPDLHEVKYSLGLLLVERKKYRAAARYFREASDALPLRSQIHYNLGLLYQKLYQDSEAETAFNRALSVEPNNPDFLYALAVFYLQRERLDDAQEIAEKIVAQTPAKALGYRIIKGIQAKRKSRPFDG